MPTGGGTGPGSGGPTPCEDRLAAVERQIEAIQKQYRDLDGQILALQAEANRLQGIIPTIWRGGGERQGSTAAVAVASVAQALGQAEEADTAATVEVSTTAGLSPVVLLIRRAAALGVRLSDLERRV